MTSRLAVLLILLSSLGSAQQTQQTPDLPPDTKAPAPKPPEAKPGTATQPPAPKRKTPDKAAAYYHYSLAHIYEELVATYGRTEFASRAIEEYKKAIEADPTSEFLNAGLAELYAKTGRIRDAVLEAQEILKRDPNNVEARKLLGRIYLRSLGDLQAGTQSQQVLRLAIEQFEVIVRLEPQNIDNHLLLGRLYRLDNQMLKAEEAFQRALKIHPDAEEAATALAYLYNEEGDSARAIHVLEALPEKSTRVWGALGYSYEQLHDYKKAIFAFQQAVHMDRDNLDAMRGLAQNLLNDGQTQAALEQYKQILELDPQDAQAYLRVAEIHRRAGKFDLALENLRKAGSLVPDSLEVPYNTAMVYEAQGRYDEAIAILQKLLDRPPTNPAMGYSSGEKNNRTVFLERIGSIYRDQKKYPQAIETFRRILAMGEENATRGYQQLIETYRDAKQWDQATAVAKEAVEKLPKDRMLKLVLAGQMADSGHADQALAEARAMLNNTPEDREVWIAIAQMNSRLRRWKDAEQAIGKAEELSRKPEEKEYVYFVRGSIYERQKKYDAAEEMFKRVLAADPQNATALNYLGYMLADRGVRLDEALGYIKRAVELEPQNGAYLDSLGWAYFKLGNLVLAEQNLRRAAEKLPNDSTILDHLADLYHKTGRLKLAVSHWERALAEWARSVPAEVDQDDVARVQKKLESAKVRLAQQGATTRKP